jgi:hypothetical protein
MYLEHDSKPYCKICHGKLFLPPCAECKKDITGVSGEMRFCFGNAIGPP